MSRHDCTPRARGDDIILLINHDALEYNSSMSMLPSNLERITKERDLGTFYDDWTWNLTPNSYRVH